MAKNYWSLKEFMAETGVSRTHAYKLVNNKEIVSIRLGRKILIPVAAFENSIASGLHKNEK